MSNHMSERRPPTAAEREARKVFRDADAKVPVSEHERAQQAFHANRERLKASAWPARLPQPKALPASSAAGHEERPRSHEDQDHGTNGPERCARVVSPGREISCEMQQPRNDVAI
jgi:hypothetical protein